MQLVHSEARASDAKSAYNKGAGGDAVVAVVGIGKCIALRVRYWESESDGSECKKTDESAHGRWRWTSCSDVHGAPFGPARQCSAIQ